MTFSVLIDDPESGLTGAAVCTGVPGVGMLCLFGDGATGVVATQAMVNPYLGPAVLDLMRELPPDEAVQRAYDADPERADENRQLHAVSRSGAAAAITASRCEEWAGHRTGDRYSIAGNILVGPQVVDAIAAQVEDPHEGEGLPERLMRAMWAGFHAGGDTRGHRSAAIVVFADGPIPVLRLHVEDSDDPLRLLDSAIESTQSVFRYMVDHVERALRPGGVGADVRSSS